MTHTERRTIETDIVTRTVDALLAAGYILREREVRLPQSRQDLLDTCFDVDDAVVCTHHTETGKNSFVRFVFGNDGYDVIADYGVSLEDILAPINAYADTIADRVFSEEGAK
jgi:hypothetical protein